MVSLRAIERLFGLASTEVQIFARDLEAQLKRIEEDRQRLVEEEEDAILVDDGGIEMRPSTTSTTTPAPIPAAPTTSTSASIFMSTASPATMSGGSLQVITPTEAAAALNNSFTPPFEG